MLASLHTQSKERCRYTVHTVQKDNSLFLQISMQLSYTLMVPGILSPWLLHLHLPNICSQLYNYRGSKQLGIHCEGEHIFKVILHAAERRCLLNNTG